LISYAISAKKVITTLTRPQAKQALLGEGQRFLKAGKWAFCVIQHEAILDVTG